MSQTPDDARGFWYYTGVILGGSFAIVGVLAGVAIFGAIAHGLVNIFLMGWRAF